MTDGNIEVIDNLAAKFGMAIDWTSSNIVPYLQELADRFIKYEIATSCALIGLMVVLCAMSWPIAKAVHKYWINKEEDERYHKFEYLDDGQQVAIVLLYAIAVGLTIAMIAVTAVQIFDIIEAKTLPEKTIYDYIQHSMTCDAH